MLEWTGERFLPWIKESTIAYEHLHRYAYAAMFVKNKRVLDLASGEGYGSKMLARAAVSVVGVDIDENTVRHARSKYGSKNLQFITGSVTAVPIEEDHSFDVIVCFEAIEHIEDQEKLLSEVTRLLKPEGLFLVSTPNKAAYHGEDKAENPFHIKELEFDEFRQLLARHFENLRFLGQRVLPGSSIWTIGVTNGAGFEEFVMERGETEFQFIADERRIPVYFIALASNSTIPLQPDASVLLDHSDSLVQEKNEEIQATRKEIQWREQQIHEREDDIKSLQAAIEWKQKHIQSLEDAIKWQEQQVSDRQADIASLKQALEWSEQQINDRKADITSLKQAVELGEGHIAELQKAIASRDEALEWRAGQVEQLQNERAALVSDLTSTRQQFNLATEQLEGIYASRSWKFVLRVRSIRDRLKRLLRRTG